MVVVVIFFFKKIGMRVEGWPKLKFYVPFRTTEYSFEFRAMNSLIAFHQSRL